MTDDFEKAMSDEAIKYHDEQMANGELGFRHVHDLGQGFCRGAKWAFTHLDKTMGKELRLLRLKMQTEYEPKTTVPAEIVKELAAVLEQIEEKFYSNNLNIEEFRYLSAFLYNRAVKALTRYRELLKNKGE